MCRSKRIQNPPQILARRVCNPPTCPLGPKALLSPRKQEVPSAYSSSWVAVLEDLGASLCEGAPIGGLDALRGLGELLPTPWTGAS